MLKYLLPSVIIYLVFYLHYNIFTLLSLHDILESFLKGSVLPVHSEYTPSLYINFSNPISSPPPPSRCSPFRFYTRSSDIVLPCTTHSPVLFVWRHLPCLSLRLYSDLLHFSGLIVTNRITQKTIHIYITLTPSTHRQTTQTIPDEIQKFYNKTFFSSFEKLSFISCK